MQHINTSASIYTVSRSLLASSLGFAVLFVAGAAAADEGPVADAGLEAAEYSAASADDASGWSFNFTPVLVLPKGEYRLGGGTHPELRYTKDLGGLRLSVGGRAGAYYAKNLFGVTVMPTARVTLPLGPVEPYLAGGVGYGWLPTIQRDGLASMARFGTVFHFTDSFAIGVEATLQGIQGSKFEFPSFGSMMSIDL